MRGRPWPFDFQRQKQTKAFPMPANQRVGLNDRQGFAPRQQLRNFVGAITRRGWRWRSTRKANCLRRKRFSAAKAQRDRRLALTNLTTSSRRSNSVSSSLDTESNVGIGTGTHTYGRCCHPTAGIATYEIIADHTQRIAHARR
jgi:hypothetical protein